MISKILLLLFVSSLAVSALEKIEPTEIIPKFYKILFSVDRPSEQDEINFFGGKSCDPLRTILSTNKVFLNYSKSKTPIWDYLRDHKDYFLTLNIKEIARMRIQATDPVEVLRLYNNTKRQEKLVFVTFPTEIVVPPGGSKGISVGIFTLGEDCYLDVGSTIMVSGDTKVLIGEMLK
jgi:hypothetical protein